MNIRKIVKKVIPKNVFRSIEPLGHGAEALMWNVRYGFPARGLKVIGVTGTNGKTTTSFMIHRMLHEAGYKVGLMTTVAYGAGDDIQPQIAHMTTLSSKQLLERVIKLKKQGIEWLVLETTSHALAQHRVLGVPYSIAVMTNVTHEHLDYHGTFKRYLAAKVKLFRLANRHGARVGIVNAEDPNAKAFMDAVKHPITYGVDLGDVRASEVQLTPAGSSYTANLGGKQVRVDCHIPGRFNIYNSLAAAVTGHVVGLTAEQIHNGIDALQGVEGRMTRVDEGQPFDVIVDFAHTPDSFEKLFKDLKPVVKGKLIVLFGSAGRRDEAKRAIQGELAGQYADEVVITEEDDRDIDGLQIMDEIAAGAEKAGKTRDKDLFLVHNRTEAIQFAVKRAVAGDTVLLLGKGHEKTIERADGEHSWDEIGTTKTAIEQL